MIQTDHEAIHTIRTALRTGALRVCPAEGRFCLEADDGPDRTWDLAVLLDHLEDCEAIAPIHDRAAVTEQVISHARHLHHAGHAGLALEPSS